MSANRGGRKPFSGGFAGATVEEKAAADEAARTVTHPIEDYSYPDLRGKDNVRWVEFQGSDRIVLIPVEDGKGGVIARKDVTYKLSWERLK